MPKISVIVPMYNVEKYVRCAIQSVLDQTFKDFELILIDDCSTDKTVEVAKSFNDPRIKIFNNEKNLGAGLTRNVGLEIATGDYIYFFDSDDALIPNALEMLYNVAEKDQFDVSMSIAHFYPNDNEFQNFKNLNARIHHRGKMGSFAKDFKQRITEEYIMGSSSACRLELFKRKFLDDSKIKFRNIVAYEDGIFWFEVLCATSNMIKIDKPFYVYRQRQGSLIHPKDLSGFRKLIESFFMCREIFLNLLAKYGEKDNYFVDNILLSFTRRIFWDFIPFYQRIPQKCWEIIESELELRYKDDQERSMIRIFFFGYFMEIINRQVYEDRSKRYEDRLKAIRSHVNDIIRF